MSKGIIISAFATCGKSILGKKYKNVLDLESSYYKYKIANDNLTVEERKGTKKELSHFTTSDGRLIHTQRSYRSHRK